MLRCLIIWMGLLPLFSHGQESFDQLLKDSLNENETESDAISEEEIQKDSKKLKRKKVTELSGLSQLAPFRDIAVIQKRFLPKSNRFELAPSVGFIVNDAFFLTGDLTLRFGYYFSDSLSFEAGYFGFVTGNKAVTRILESKNIVTQSFVSPQSFYGAAIKWVPIYGKIASFDKKILYFDLFFLVGGGLTKTNQNSTPGSVHIGGGQSFALSKSWALRFNIDWFYYKASAATTGNIPTAISNLHASIGLSFFFPGVSYR